MRGGPLCSDTVSVSINGSSRRFPRLIDGFRRGERIRCLFASCAVGSSPRYGSSATFALKSAEYRFRLPVIQVRRSQEKTELKPLSEFVGPPQIGLRSALPTWPS